MIHQITRNRTLASFRQFHGKMWVGFGLNTEIHFITDILENGQSKKIFSSANLYLGFLKFQNFNFKIFKNALGQFIPNQPSLINLKNLINLIKSVLENYKWNIENKLKKLLNMICAGPSTFWGVFFCYSRLYQIRRS